MISFIVCLLPVVASSACTGRMQQGARRQATGAMTSAARSARKKWPPRKTLVLGRLAMRFRPPAVSSGLRQAGADS